MSAPGVAQGSQIGKISHSIFLEGGGEGGWGSRPTAQNQGEE